VTLTVAVAVAGAAANDAADAGTALDDSNSVDLGVSVVAHEPHPLVAYDAVDAPMTESTPRTASGQGDKFAAFRSRPIGERRR